MFQLWVWEGTATATLSATHPNSIAESLLHIGNVVVRRQDTHHARVQVVEPLVGSMRVAQVFDSRRTLSNPCLHCLRPERDLCVSALTALGRRTSMRDSHLATPSARQTFKNVPQVKATAKVPG